eukprot:jgi/Picre1/30618/NNA_005979.t1
MVVVQGAGRAGGGGSALELYYVAVGSQDAVLDTLIELIIALKYEDRSISIVICCGSRDHVDDVTRAVKDQVGQRVGGVNLWCLHSDLGERDVMAYANQFKDISKQNALLDWHDAMDQESTSCSSVRHPVHVLVTSDAPLQTLIKMNSAPLAPTVMIHYNLPRRKEDYNRRNGVILGSRSRSEGKRVAICFVEASRLEELHQFEDFAERSLKEMPVHVKDIFE